MKKIIRILLCTWLALVGQTMRAQEFTTLDWNVMHIDSLLPVYSEVVPLESDFRQNDYRVTLEYPEWKALTAAETKALLAIGEKEKAKAHDDALADFHKTSNEAKPSFASISEEICISTFVGVSRRQGLLDISFIPIVCRNGHYQKLVSCKIKITPVPRIADGRTAKRVATRATEDETEEGTERYTRTSKLSAGKWVKISVKEDGMYRLTNTALKKMGFSKPENVHVYGYGGYRLSEKLMPEAMFDDLVEVPLYREGTTSYFWGNGLVYWEGDKRIFNPYATKACYFLTEEDIPATVQTEAPVTGTVRNTYTTTPAHTLYEKDEFSWFQGGRNLYESQNIAGKSRTYKLLTDACATPGNERLTVSMSGYDVKVTASVNGKSQSPNLVHTSLADFVYTRLQERTYNISDCGKGDNQWDVTLQASGTGEARLDYLALHYNRNIVTTNGFTTFSQPKGKGVSKFEITAGHDAKVMRLPEPDLPGAFIPMEKSAEGRYTVTVDDPSHRYVCFEPSHIFPEPTFEGSIENQNLHALDSLDMVIIIPTNGKMRAQAERLVEAHRVYDGLRVGVVRADQVYNEFSSGTPDATAYRHLMKMLYDRAEENAQPYAVTQGYDGPRYLLLMGDCLWDNRMLTPATRHLSPDDYLLCFESENSWNDTESYVMEDYFGLLDDGEGATLTRDKTDLGIGRFPVKSANEAKGMVDKTITFLSNRNAGSWKNIVMMMGDDGDYNSHMDYCNDVAESIIEKNPELEVRKVMWDAYTRVSSIAYNTYPEVTELVIKQNNEGALMMNYTGHAAPYSMSHEWVLQPKDFAAMKGVNAPLWFTAGCDVMPFDSQHDNMGVTAALNPDGAAVAFIGTARTVYASNNRRLNLFFCDYLFGTDQHGRRHRLGDALRLSKTSLVDVESIHLENKLQYALLGDPALTIGAPLNRVWVDKLVNAKTGEHVEQLKAGMAVRLEGRLLDSKGNDLTQFDGIVTARVYDALDTIVCKRNDTKVNEAFEFTDRSKVLFAGRDSVRAGRFALSFIVPQDIKHSFGEGRVVFYAVNDSLTLEANGYYEDFIVGGAEPTEDNEGPQIELALNDGEEEVVNAMPLLTARLEDESGINNSGVGIGHDITLCIDGDARQTYNLNDRYQPDFGDYTRGSLAFTIPTLAPGRHTLTLRAWDLQNNTSTRSLDFEVDATYEPTILSIKATPSVATQSATFFVSYNLPGAATELDIEVFDYAGRRLWRYEGTSSSESGTIAVPWNLRVGDNRGRISSGIYLYRASIRCGESKWVTKSSKLIVK